MPNRRSKKKLEERLAKKYVYQHSVTVTRNNDPNEMRERVFTGTSQDLEGYVLAECKGERQGIIPEYPQGLVFSDSRGQGFFDVVPVSFNFSVTS